MKNPEDEYYGQIEEWYIDDIRLWDNKANKPVYTNCRILHPDRLNTKRAAYKNKELKYLYVERMLDYVDSNGTQLGQGDILEARDVKWELCYGEYINLVFWRDSCETIRHDFVSFGWYLKNIENDFTVPLGCRDSEQQINGYFTIVGHKKYIGRMINDK